MPSLPDSNLGSIILITEKKDLAETIGKVIEIGGMDRDEGGELLRRHLRFDASHMKFTKEVAAEMGGMPVLLIGAAAQIKNSLFQQAEILEVLRKQRRSPREPPPLVDTKEAWDRQDDIVLAPVWDVALRHIPDGGQEMLETLALFSSDGAPEELFLMNPTIAIPSAKDVPFFRWATTSPNCVES